MDRMKKKVIALTYVESCIHSGGVATLELDRSSEVAVSVWAGRLESTSYTDSSILSLAERAFARSKERLVI